MHDRNISLEDLNQLRVWIELIRRPPVGLRTELLRAEIHRLGFKKARCYARSIRRYLPAM